MTVSTTRVPMHIPVLFRRIFHLPLTEASGWQTEPEFDAYDPYGAVQTPMSGPLPVPVPDNPGQHPSRPFGADPPHKFYFWFGHGRADPPVWLLSRLEIPSRQPDIVFPEFFLNTLT